MADENTPQSPSKVPTKPGILCVGSKSINPDVLKPLDFCEWYEKTQIPAVQQTGGFSATQRYEALTFAKMRGSDISVAPENINFDYDFWTTYTLPDLTFRDSKEYQSLSELAKPNDPVLVDKLFKQAEFHSRFCEQMSVDWPDEGGPAAPYLVTLTSSSAQTARDLADKITKFSGCLRTKSYKIHEVSVLRALERTYRRETSDLYYFEFNELDRLGEVAKVVEGVDSVQVGFWSLRRAFDGTERAPAAWKPSS